MAFHEYKRMDAPKAVEIDEDDMAASYDRDLGDHSARLGMIEKDLQGIKSDLRDIRDVVVQGKGGWRVLTVVGGFAAAIGAIVTKLMPLLIALPK